MTATRKRQIVKRVILAVAVTSLLPIWHVAAWLTVSHAAKAGIVTKRAAESSRPLFLPLIRYAESDLPGADWLFDFWWWANPPKRVVYAGGGRGLEFPALSPSGSAKQFVASGELLDFLRGNP